MKKTSGVLITGVIACITLAGVAGLLLFVSEPNEMEREKNVLTLELPKYKGEQVVFKLWRSCYQAEVE